MCDFAIAMLGFGGGRTQPILGYWKCPYLRSMIRMTIYNCTSRSMVLVWDTGSLKKTSSTICAMVKSRYIVGMVIPPSIGILIMGI